jgi:hypothetical protein
MKNLLLAWCDNSTVEGPFAESLVMLTTQQEIPISAILRVQGNQIGRQRQQVVDFIVAHPEIDGIFWIDSDISMKFSDFEKLYSSIDIEKSPIVTGVYYILKENGFPKPAIFNFDKDEEFIIHYIHDFEEDSLIPVEAAGFGFLFMHRSVIDKMVNLYNGMPLFNETGVGEQFVSEDIRFFKLLKNAEIPFFCHTGSTPEHIKKMRLNKKLYDLCRFSDKEIE